jgi:hypothetical protein
VAVKLEDMTPSNMTKVAKKRKQTKGSNHQT